MRTKAWGWLAVAVLAAGLNSSYHEGGMQWAHEIADRVEHNTGAVLALATGRADQFLAEARMLNVDRAVDSVKEVKHSRCPFTAATEQAQTALDESQVEFDRFQALSDRQQAKLARLEANRARIEARLQARLAQVRFADDNFSFTDDTDLTPVISGASNSLSASARSHATHPESSRTNSQDSRTLPRGISRRRE